MKCVEPEMEVVELDATVITQLSTVDNDQNVANQPPSIGNMLD